MQNFSRLEWIFYILAGFFKTLAARGASSLFQAIKTAKEIFWKVCSNKFVLGEQSFSDFLFKQLKIPPFLFQNLDCAPSWKEKRSGGLFLHAHALTFENIWNKSLSFL